MVSANSDVIESRIRVTEVLHGSQRVARVFQGYPGCFHWVSLIDDRMPSRAFRSREQAEIDADITLDLERLTREQALMALDT